MSKHCIITRRLSFTWDLWTGWWSRAQRTVRSLYGTCTHRMTFRSSELWSATGRLWMWLTLTAATLFRHRVTGPSRCGTRQPVSLFVHWLATSEALLACSIAAIWWWVGVRISPFACGILKAASAWGSLKATMSLLDVFGLIIIGLLVELMMGKCFEQMWSESTCVIWCFYFLVRFELIHNLLFVIS